MKVNIDHSPLNLRAKELRYGIVFTASGGTHMRVHSLLAHPPDNDTTYVMFFSPSNSDSHTIIEVKLTKTYENVRYYEGAALFLTP
jgi:hypothetical protein